MKSVRLAFIAALIIAATTAYAQQSPPEGPRFDNAQGQNGPDAKKREEVRKKVEAVRMWRLTEELKLDEKTSTRLASFLSAMDEKRRDLLRERAETMRDLRAEVKAGNPDEKKMRASLDRLEKNRRDMMELEGKETGGIKNILSVEQQARYVIFQQEFRRELRGMIAGARGSGQGMRGPGGGTVGKGPGAGDGPGGPPER
jgi:Spy/CpxP family protein refolding chaperone